MYIDIKLLIETDTIGHRLAQDVVSAIHDELRPGSGATSEEWRDWADVLNEKLGRHEETEAAYREAISRDNTNLWPWLHLGDLLSGHLDRYNEAEEAYRKAIACDKKMVWAWVKLGNLHFDRLHRLADAESAYEMAMELDPRYTETSAQHLLFLKRDYLGEGTATQPLFNQLFAERQSRFPDVIELHHALFAAYEENWGLARARDALGRALLTHEIGLFQRHGRRLGPCERRTAAPQLRRTLPRLAARQR